MAQAAGSDPRCDDRRRTRSPRRSRLSGVPDAAAAGRDRHRRRRGLPRTDHRADFMAQSGHTKRDLPALLAAAWERHPQLDIKLAVPIGEAPDVVSAIARYALQPTLVMGEAIPG
ncbi:MAG: CbiX/SirB N-terminal domain-containing protein [Comamonadaceae bacterium]|nr:CbiX/SirB N-terminal domain-containing protein [Comamonadaceae bacterium]